MYTFFHYSQVFRYEDAKGIFARTIDQLENQGDLLEAVHFRLYHAECLVNMGHFDEAVLDYLEAMEHDSCLAQITLQSLSNAHVAKLTSCIIDQASGLVNEISSGDGEESEPNAADSALQLYHRLYKLLYAIDSENIDALRKCAESLQVSIVSNFQFNFIHMVAKTVQKICCCFPWVRRILISVFPSSKALENLIFFLLLCVYYTVKTPVHTF